jgi:lipoyl(octanoyl) transferase
MFEVQNWGLIDYQTARDKQKKLVIEIQKHRNKNVLVLCEHPAVITIGKSGSMKNLLVKPDFLESLGINVVNIDRGGDVTLHNPGQLVGYPIFNLSNYKEDLHWFLREIENCIIQLLIIYGIKSNRIDGQTGVWVQDYKKIAAIGLHCSRWVTSHGFALNVKNDLSQFDYIIPCGIKDKTVTSIEKETGTEIDFDDVKNECIKSFRRSF